MAGKGAIHCIKVLKPSVRWKNRHWLSGSDSGGGLLRSPGGRDYELHFHGRSRCFFVHEVIE